MTTLPSRSTSTSADAVRRISYVFLCAIPFLNFGVIGARALRPYWFAGIVYFAAMIIAAWSLCGRALRSGTEREQRMSLTGGLLILFTVVTALLWVGLAPPFQATPIENRMRYMVLVLGSVAVTIGFVLLEALVRENGEYLLSRIAATVAMLGGAAYLIWNCHALGVYVIRVRTGHVPTEFTVMSEVLDSLLFAACVLTYLATLGFALSMGRVGLLSRGGKIGFAVANLILLGLLLVRGLSFPDPRATSTPWYFNLGFIAGIPAVPWIMPYLFGVVLLRRAGMQANAAKMA
jgi:hypothetical protein